MNTNDRNGRMPHISSPLVDDNNSRIFHQNTPISKKRSAASIWNCTLGKKLVRSLSHVFRLPARKRSLSATKCFGTTFTSITFDKYRKWNDDFRCFFINSFWSWVYSFLTGFKSVFSSRRWVGSERSLVSYLVLRLVFMMLHTRSILIETVWNSTACFSKCRLWL